jgi:hypothetical protein
MPMMLAHKEYIEQQNTRGLSLPTVQICDSSAYIMSSFIQSLHFSPVLPVTRSHCGQLLETFGGGEVEIIHYNEFYGFC